MRRNRGKRLTCDAILAVLSLGTVLALVVVLVTLVILGILLIVLVIDVPMGRALVSIVAPCAIIWMRICVASARRRTSEPGRDRCQCRSTA